MPVIAGNGLPDTSGRMLEVKAGPFAPAETAPGKTPPGLAVFDELPGG
jgi:hypothetical protein